MSAFDLSLSSPLDASAVPHCDPSRTVLHQHKPRRESSLIRRLQSVRINITKQEFSGRRALTLSTIDG